MPDLPTVALNSGHKMPQLGFGVFQIPNDETERAVSTAFEAGYRSIDTAAMYQNEPGVAAAISASGIPRDELFITTKLNNNALGSEARPAPCRESLDKLGLDYLALYLIHWPLPAKDLYVETWKALIS